MYRILHAHHPPHGRRWCIYPMYDFAHGQSDAIEGITHSLCTLEFEDHRPLYDWFVENLPVAVAAASVRVRPAQLSYTVLSQAHPDRAGARRARRRAGTIRACRRSPGMRRRGVPPEAIRDFGERIGVTKANSVVDVAVRASPCARS